MPPLFEAKHISNAPLIVKGGYALEGSFEVLGMKNAALPIIAATLLSPEPIVLNNVPRLSDVECLLDIMRSLGTEASWLAPHKLLLHTPALSSTEPPASLVAKMRASSELLGPLLARGGEAKLSLPGGCSFGPRPIDQHVKAFRAMGATVADDMGGIHAVRDRPLSGRVVFDLITNGGTRNAMMAAVLGEGTVRLENCALEPEGASLAEFLNALGAKIHGAGTHTVDIEGVKKLGGGEFDLPPDRLEAGTIMLAAAASRGRVVLEQVSSEHMRSLSAKLVEAGIKVLEIDSRTIQVDAHHSDPKGIIVHVAEYPGFATDLQPPMAAFLAGVHGASTVTDRIYPTRFGYSSELAKMGAQLDVTHGLVNIEGTKLRGAHVAASDIRAGGALIVAAVAAEGESVISGMEFINRGHEDIESRLQAIGAQVSRLPVGAATL